MIDRRLGEGPAKTGGEEWRELFLAAEEFRLLAPWEWMDDSQIFGVRDPWTGGVGWCVVMGAEQLTYGLAVYRGERGYGSYRLTMAEGDDGADAVAHMDCLLLEFCDREELTDVDRKQVKAAGLKPRGRGVWPQFRSFLPWHMPWYLNSGEARYMRLVLGQACRVAAALRGESELPLRRGSGLLVREAQASGSDWVWGDTWVEPSLPGRVEEVCPAEEMVRPVLSGCVRTTETWEVDVFPLMAMVSEGGERPWWPPMLLVASDGFPPAVQAESVRPGPGMWEDLLRAWLRGVAKGGKLPGRLRVKRDEVAAMLGPTARLLGVPLQKKKRLRRLDELRQSLEQTLVGDLS
ncbi:MAG TPA: hypothetical protein GX513_05875 [Firmicutes bacterium]|nr:hypothetical protein [Bacillota bacterium]